MVTLSLPTTAASTLTVLGTKLWAMNLSLSVTMTTLSGNSGTDLQFTSSTRAVKGTERTNEG